MKEGLPLQDRVVDQLKMLAVSHAQAILDGKKEVFVQEPLASEELEVKAAVAVGLGLSTYHRILSRRHA